MKYTLKNGKIAAVLDSMGAELRSLKAADGTEYLWQGDEKYWTGQAPNLFPIVGRLTQGKYTYKGKTYDMTIHGFARHSEFAIAEKSADKIVFVMNENAETLKCYPFKFRFSVTYTLKDDTLYTEYGVTNTGGGELIASAGGHPGFNVPLGGEGKFDDWYLEFEPKSDAKEIVLTAACFITDDTKLFKLKDGKLPLKHGLFDNDAIVLADMPKTVTLKSNASKRIVTVSYPDMKYLGLWHKPKSDAPYVCIEPWASLPSYDGVIDDFDTKRDMVKLRPGESYKAGFLISAK